MFVVPHRLYTYNKDQWLDHKYYMDNCLSYRYTYVITSIQWLSAREREREREREWLSARERGDGQTDTLSLSFSLTQRERERERVHICFRNPISVTRQTAEYETHQNQTTQEHICKDIQHNKITSI